MDALHADQPNDPAAEVSAQDLSSLPTAVAQAITYARELSALYARSKEQLAAIEYQTTHDGLTELPNRSFLAARLEDLLAERSERQAPFALLILNLDRFKEVNATLGHANGDQLLRQIAGRLSTASALDDVVARIVGDEFAVMIPAADAVGAMAVAERLLRALRDPFSVAGLSLEMAATIGIVIFPEHGGDVDTLFRRAEIAVDGARSSHAEIAIFTHAFDEYSPERLVLAGELRRAIDHNQLLLHYQPQFDCKTGQIRGVEALVRWQHPERGLVPPDRFIPLAEHTGLIKPLSLWVLNEALRQQAEWRAAGFEPMMAVNMSARNVVDLSLANDVADTLHRWSVQANTLNIEITESAVMEDHMRATDTLARLHAMGIRLSIDDFGTGHSSLAYLKNLPVDEIKIDKSFVMQMGAEPKDAAIVHSIVELGRNLEMEVIGEGVDSGESWTALKTLGCHAGQGYFLGRPMPPEIILANRLTPAPFRSPAPTSPVIPRAVG
jgi:diguanylate cyclase